MVSASELRAGMVIRVEGDVYKVLEVDAKAGAAKLGGVVKTKLSNVNTGRLWEPHFRPQERFEELGLERRSMEFLFSDDESCTFMNPETFEQVEVPRAILGSGEQFLQSGTQVPVELFEGRPISVILPDVVEAKIADTAPAAHAQQDSTWKEATLDNGVVIRVPLFIGPGETIRVDVRTLRYVERVKAERKRTV
jgi:elongation factor P